MEGRSGRSPSGTFLGPPSARAETHGGVAGGHGLGSSRVLEARAIPRVSAANGHEEMRCRGESPAAGIGANHRSLPPAPTSGCLGRASPGKEQESDYPEAPIHSLQILEVRQYETLTGGIEEVGDCDGMMGARDLFWAIHGGAVVHTGGTTENEVVAIKNELAESFDESYDPAAGIVRGAIVACVFRKNDSSNR